LPRKKTEKRPAHNYINKVFHQEELNKKLYIGMTSKEVIKLFGKPYITLDFILIYKINPEKISVEKDTFFTSGFSVNLSNGKVTHWGLISTIINETGSFNDNNPKTLKRHESNGNKK
jgi:hypothetical protein